MADIALKYKVFGSAKDPGPGYMTRATEKIWDYAQDERWDKLEVLSRDITSAICY